jgi:hypothetical protein
VDVYSRRIVGWRFSTVRDNAPAHSSARLEIAMTALPSGRRVIVPAYYLGRPAYFWITRLSTRRRGPRAAAPAESPDRSRR